MGAKRLVHKVQIGELAYLESLQRSVMIDSVIFCVKKAKRRIGDDRNGQDIIFRVKRRQKTI